MPTNDFTTSFPLASSVPLMERMGTKKFAVFDSVGLENEGLKNGLDWRLTNSLHHGKGVLTTHDGTRLYEQWWLPPAPKAAVVLVHGYAEHCGRYSHVAETFVEHGYAVYGYDHRSHGRSEGTNTFIESFDLLVEDLAGFVEETQSRIGQLPLFILGHSLGGLISSLYLVQQPDKPQGMVLSGPFVAMNRRIPSMLVQLAGTVGTIAPKLPTVQLTYKFVTQDPEMLARHAADPLIFRGRMPARTGAEISQGLKKIRRSMEAIQAPLLIVHGGDDAIAPVAGSHELIKRASSADKMLKVYDGLYHEVLNEVKRERVMADIITWMDKRYAPR